MSSSIAQWWTRWSSLVLSPKLTRTSHHTRAVIYEPELFPNLTSFLFLIPLLSFNPKRFMVVTDSQLKTTAPIFAPMHYRKPRLADRTSFPILSFSFPHSPTTFHPSLPST